MSANSGRQEKGEEERSKEYIKLKGKQGKLNLKQPGGSCTGLLDFPSWSKVLVTNKNPEEIPVWARAGGALHQRRALRREFGGVLPW